MTSTRWTKVKLVYSRSKIVAFSIMKVGFEYLRELCRMTHVSSEDELQNVEMAEEERRQKNQDLKIKRRDYTGYDDDEFKEGSLGLKKSILAKYDEDLEGPQDSVSAFLLHLCLTHIILLGLSTGVSDCVKEGKTRRRTASCSCSC